MSLFSALMASVSGMNAQANSLSTISDNIANADTTGYKQASTQFEDMLNEVSTSQYNAGGVATIVGYSIAQQGDLTPTNSATDLAIQGNGFFVVENASGDTFLTLRRVFYPERQRRSRQRLRLHAARISDQRDNRYDDRRYAEPAGAGQHLDRRARGQSFHLGNIHRQSSVERHNRRRHLAFRQHGGIDLHRPNIACRL